MEKFENHIGLVHRQAKFGYAWAGEVGISALSYEDMFQEASVAFVIAAEGFDPNAGLKFSTYYTKVAFSQIRRAIGIMSGVKNLNPTQRKELADRKDANEVLKGNALATLPSIAYGIRPLSFAELAHEDDLNFEESLVSDSPTPEQILEHRQDVESRISVLSPLARLIVEWLTDPPPELIDELGKTAAHVDYLIAQGQKSTKRGANLDVTFKSVENFIRLVSKVEKSKIKTAHAELVNFAPTL